MQADEHHKRLSDVRAPASESEREVACGEFKCSRTRRSYRRRSSQPRIQFLQCVFVAVQTLNPALQLEVHATMQYLATSWTSSPLCTSEADMLAQGLD